MPYSDFTSNAISFAPSVYSDTTGVDEIEVSSSKAQRLPTCGATDFVEVLGGVTD